VDASYQGRLRLDGIIAVVDAEQLPAQVADPVTRDLIYGQIGCSDLVLLNNIDLADRHRVDAVRAFVTERLGAVRMIETVRTDVPLPVLLGRACGARSARKIGLIIDTGPGLSAGCIGARVHSPKMRCGTAPGAADDRWSARSP